MCVVSNTSASRLWSASHGAADIRSVGYRVTEAVATGCGAHCHGVGALQVGSERSLISQGLAWFGGLSLAGSAAKPTLLGLYGWVWR